MNRCVQNYTFHVLYSRIAPVLGGSQHSRTLSRVPVDLLYQASCIYHSSRRRQQGLQMIHCVTCSNAQASCNGRPVEMARSIKPIRSHRRDLPGWHYEHLALIHDTGDINVCQRPSYYCACSRSRVQETSLLQLNCIVSMTYTLVYTLAGSKLAAKAIGRKARPIALARSIVCDAHVKVLK